MSKDGHFTVPDDGYNYSLEIKKTINGNYYRLIRGSKKDNSSNNSTLNTDDKSNSKDVSQSDI